MKKVAALLALALASVALVACGSSSDDSSSPTATSGGESSTPAESGGKANAGGGTGGGASSTLEFEADPGGELAFTTTTASAKAGNVTIDFKNPQALTHDVQIEDAQGEDVGGTELIASGDDSTTVDLKPGKYHFFCSVPGHREAGMEGVLTVK